MRLKSRAFLVTVSVLALAATAARADVTISSDATANMSCAGGICVPTASDAVLNVTDLQTMLAAGNVTVTTTGSGAQANNIDVASSLGWSANTLTLDAFHSISVTAPVTVKGKNGLSILTDDGGSGGELAFFGKGHVTFKKLSGKLTINGTPYALVNSIKSLAAAIEKKSSGAYALAEDFNAKGDGTYEQSPIATPFKGSFEGLGNNISKMKILIPLETSTELTGLFAESFGVIRDVGITASTIVITRFEHKKKKFTPTVGILVGTNGGSILRSFTDGSISAPYHTEGGGLVGQNVGTISESYSEAAVSVGVGDTIDFSDAGGLVGSNSGRIITSFAGGAVSAGEIAGGLVGDTDGQIENSYATGAVNSGGASGGLVGYNYGSWGGITISYSSGAVEGLQIGGLLGADGSPAGNLSNTYWDMDTSGITNPDQGAGSPLNDPGIAGLTTEQLQSNLPAGFDPAVWGESPEINNGLPYLLANPPK